MYAVIAAGGLQIADIVVHALALPSWTLRALVWLSAVGLPTTFVISWFWDLTRHGFVRTVMPSDRGTPGPLPSPHPEHFAEAAAALQAMGPGGVLAGRYRIERELGAGGAGRVLAAQDLRLGRRVAIKLVTSAHDPARVRRFEQEARTAGSLEHPNVVAVYDLGEQDGIPFLVTELLEGQTLRKVIESGPLPPEQVHGLALQLARGLGAAHASGVVHRDLKPENLFLTRGGRSGPQSDVFSAGAVLYELLTGKRAFPGASLVEAGHAAITFDPPPLPGGVPPQLAAVVARALQKDPDQRFADGAALAEALERSGLEPAPVRKGARGRRRASTRRWRWSRCSRWARRSFRRCSSTRGRRTRRSPRRNRARPRGPPSPPPRANPRARSSPARRPRRSPAHFSRRPRRKRRASLDAVWDTCPSSPERPGHSRTSPASTPNNSPTR